MTTKSGTFEDNFARRMPLELKHMVFKWAVSNNVDNGGVTDIEVELAHDNKQSLKSPALDLLASLAQRYPADVYKEAAEYLTTRWFRWVFISHKEPHNSLLAAFYKQVPFDIRKRIKHIYLRKLRVTSLIHREKFPVNLDVGLDIFDYLLEIRIGGCALDFLIRQFREEPIVFSIYAAYSAAILPLKKLRRISNIDMRVVWDNHFNQDIDSATKVEEKEKLQELLFNFLREEIPAKSITSCVQK
ncbi:hypothetical protein COCC4DRAFT_190485 [Bipolaris maydis ATCC 48331]|uniref:Uncharacterized protein n=2 Tax=Cochliobolus heterostrophus TaxID=5016 RepID=M2UKQ7_COCH5|nr:uncharacterized protein COCC4DRAFT_190485 [Bipolaris maydis ATCC 48331]EMD94206.1 hypothetical protein COCHEDRAFT_1130586 [Bipolaris maydis C5]ENI07497.1 hypothetical protein COCC4DRAFT_190485 [Bipolaris maydis ATCC 48331]KAJ6209650.1 hypothetical protein PSV09DRAFT_1130586 [Bipolaris maydis]